jgi:hypothetical protein
LDLTPKSQATKQKNRYYIKQKLPHSTESNQQSEKAIYGMVKYCIFSNKVLIPNLLEYPVLPYDPSILLLDICAKIESSIVKQYLYLEMQK